MILLLLLLIVTISASEKRDTRYDDSVYLNACIDDEQAEQAFRVSNDRFTSQLCAGAAVKGKYFFVISPHEIWVTLAAIAEGADQLLKQELFELLSLPEDICSREKIYEIATTRLNSNHYVNLIHNRALFIDDAARVNPFWYNLVRRNSLLQVIPVPLKYSPIITTEIIKQTIASQTQKLNLSGNSVIINSIDYDGLWTTGFGDTIVQRAPFYSPTGQQIGAVDLMKFRSKVRIGYVASINMKIIEIPIGLNKEYSMMFALVVDNDSSLAPSVSKWTNATATEVFASLSDSYLPVDIAIPRFQISSEINVREVLEDLGVSSRLWSDPGATRYISTPPAKPSSYIQRATMTISNRGINRPQYEFPSPPVNNDDRYWREFIADRPFVIGLFDSKTYASLMFTMYSEPTYPN